MQEFLWSLVDVNAFTGWVLAALVMTVAWFIREIVGSGGLAAMSVPVLALGGLISHKAFQKAMIAVDADKDSAVVVTTGVGVFVALLLVILTVYASAKLSEARAAARKILPATPTEPGAR